MNRSDYPRSLAHYSPVLSSFEGGRRVGDRWVACCPLHEDSAPSLGFWLGRDGRLMFGCWAGCTQTLTGKLELLKHAGLTWRDTMPNSEQKKERRRLVCAYDYRDAQGKLVYQTCRYMPKDFRQRRPSGIPASPWTWNLDGVERVLYRFPELLAADEHRHVLVVAGEKDADAAAKLGLVATTNVGGERSLWQDTYSEALSGRHVIVVPDNDAPGLRHAREVIGSLVMHDVASFRLACVPQGKDLSDFLEHLRRAGVRGAEKLRHEVVKALEKEKQWRPARRVQVAMSA